MVVLADGSSNAKLRKGLKSGEWRIVSLSFAPARLSGREFCGSDRSPGCTASCIFTSGHGAFQNTQEARIRKSQRFSADPHGFIDIVGRDLESALRTAARNDQRVACRLNMYSDLPVEKLTGTDGLTLMAKYPAVTFYDYTKSERRMMAYLRGEFPPNYSLTFSRSETNQDSVKQVIAAGGNVAVVFADALPASWLGVRVIDGDQDDQRHLDPKGVIVGLSAKGKGKKDGSGFIIRTEEAA
jgi:hypothetical protein